MLFYNGDWGLGIGDWGLGNPQSPIPIIIVNYYFKNKLNNIINKIYINSNYIKYLNKINI